MKPGDDKAVHCEGHLLERAKYTMDRIDYKPVEGAEDVYVISKGKVSSRKDVFEACGSCGFNDTLIDVETSKIAHVRAYVSAFNKKNGTALKVKVVKGKIYVYDDIDEHETLTEEQFYDYEKSLSVRLAIARNKTEWQDQDGEI